MTPEQQKERVREFIKALDRADTKALDSLIAPTFLFELMMAAPGFPNRLDRAGFLETLPQMLRQILPNGFNYVCGNAVAEGPHVAMQGTCDATAANGKRYANTYHWYFRFAGDKIDNFREYMDTQTAIATFAP